MFPYKIIIHDRSYLSWSLEQSDHEINESFDPAKEKLFSKDVFLYDGKTVDITYSHIRSGISIAGVLVLEKNKTFGRTQNKKRLLYKCIPDDKQLPAFLIPYDINISFSKIQKNKYVLFKYHNWDDKIPHGILLAAIGDVDNLEHFYEYQLHCKSLHFSITDFTNKTREQLRNKSDQEYIQQILKNNDIEDRRTITNIFSIDPVNSLDFDDAFSIQTISPNKYRFSIYIANVFFWLETLNLWKSFSNRVSTIYLPDRKRPMLPTILSDSLCSLQSGSTRFAFALDLTITSEGIIEDVKYKNVAIIVSRNYRYEEDDLLYKNKDYNNILNITRKIDRSVENSHDIVSFWMIKMNMICGEYMVSKNIGIFRRAHITETQCNFDEITELSPSVQRIIKMWNNISGQYVVFDPEMDLKHDVMKIKNYIHITSPIRRLIDLLNQMIILRSMGTELSMDALGFLTDWMKNMDYINISMRSIRKIQTDCEVLHRCFTEPDIMSSQHKGVIFDKLRKTEGGFIYMVYLEDLQLLSRFKTYNELENYSSHLFSLFLFQDEHNMKKKIRVQMI